jgi:hypothetical protein
LAIFGTIGPPMTKTISIPYFPSGLRYATPLFAAFAAYLAINLYFGWTFILLVVTIIILTTKYVTRIDLTRKVYDDYLFLLGLELEKESKKFERLDKIIITKANVSQKINTRVQSRQLDWSEYTASLVFNYSDSLDLLTKNDKRELLTGLKAFAEFLNVEVEDCTTGVPYRLDLSRV